jgi:hypothetical protein
VLSRFTLRSHPCLDRGEVRVDAFDIGRSEVRVRVRVRVRVKVRVRVS